MSVYAADSSKTSSEAMERATCELAEQLERDFHDRNALYADIDASLFMEFPIEIPEAYKKTAIEVRAPLALHIAQNISAALSVNGPSVGFRPIGFGDVYQENSTRRERFFEASLAAPGAGGAASADAPVHVEHGRQRRGHPEDARAYPRRVELVRHGL